MASRCARTQFSVDSSFALTPSKMFPCFSFQASSEDRTSKCLNVDQLFTCIPTRVHYEKPHMLSRIFHAGLQILLSRMLSSRTSRAIRADPTPHNSGKEGAGHRGRARFLRNQPAVSSPRPSIRRCVSGPFIRWRVSGAGRAHRLPVPTSSLTTDESSRFWRSDKPSRFWSLLSTITSRSTSQHAQRTPRSTDKSSRFWSSNNPSRFCSFFSTRSICPPSLWILPTPSATAYSIFARTRPALHYPNVATDLLAKSSATSFVSPQPVKLRISSSSTHGDGTRMRSSTNGGRIQSSIICTAY